MTATIPLTHRFPCLQSYSTPLGSKTTRSLVRNTQTTHTSSVTHQEGPAFDFAGQQMRTPEQQGERFHFARETPPKRERERGDPDSEEDDRYGIQEYDHPHMRGSMDSERGEAFLSSPTGSSPDLVGLGTPPFTPLLAFALSCFCGRAMLSTCKWPHSRNAVFPNSASAPDGHPHE